ncbi:hypothetical protein V8F06_013835 [Rhypophila decipiens]
MSEAVVVDVVVVVKRPPPTPHVAHCTLGFQLTGNITAVILTFVSAVSSGKGESVLKAVQLLWVNLIMDTFAALALATDPPAPSVLDRKPDRKSAPLITTRMWKMIIGQAMCQLVITFTLNCRSFNTFVWLQIFNEINNRRLDNKLNIFEGITKNYWFLGINCLMVGGQVLIIFVGGPAFQIHKLNPGKKQKSTTFPQLVYARCRNKWSRKARFLSEDFGDARLVVGLFSVHLQCIHHEPRRR